MIVFKAGLVLLLIGILLFLIALVIGGSNKLYGYCIFGFTHVIGLAIHVLGGNQIC